MGSYIIRGGSRLSGEIAVGGAKNAVLPMLAASVLMDKCTLHNVPHISDVDYSIDILRELGSEVDFFDGTLYIDNAGIVNKRLDEKYVGHMRSSVIFAGALLGKFGSAELAYPGGCELGARPVDLHISSFASLGIQPIIKNDGMCFISNGIAGTTIALSLPSVGATENIMLAAAAAKGTTIISNAAKEPEIADLAAFLNNAGADIAGAGTDTVVIRGVKGIKDCEYTVMPDRIEAGTYMCAAAASGGELFIKNAVYKHNRALIYLLRQCGCFIRAYGDGIYIDAPRLPLAADKIVTAPYPGLPTDIQPQLTAVMCRSKGMCSVYESIFEGRYRHIYELKKMGANVDIRDERHFDINGVSSLCGAEVEARDLRGGAALIVAALGADGISKVKNSIHVERGYEKIEDKLRGVGADIERH